MKEMSENIQNLLTKLSIPKFNKPDQDLLESETKTYCQSITSKLQNLKNIVNFHFYHRNKLNLEMCTSFKHLSHLVQNNKIVICKADQVGRITIANYKDYQKIMEVKFEQFEILNDRNIDYKNVKFDVIMEQCYNKMIELHNLGVIKDKELFHICGIKNYNGIYKKLSGPTAKYFCMPQLCLQIPLVQKPKA